MRQEYLSYLNALWYFRFCFASVFCHSFKTTRENGMGSKKCSGFSLILMSSISIFTDGKLKPTASTAPLKHLTMTVRQVKLSNSGHGRTRTSVLQCSQFTSASVVAWRLCYLTIHLITSNDWISEQPIQCLTERNTGHIRNCCPKKNLRKPKLKLQVFFTCRIGSSNFVLSNIKWGSKEEQAPLLLIVIQSLRRRLCLELLAIAYYRV